jgi:hypothetical protein
MFLVARSFANCAFRLSEVFLLLLQKCELRRSDVSGKLR